MYSFSESLFDINTFFSQVINKPEKRIVLFGAAGYGEALLGELRNRRLLNPFCFTDNDKTKHGKRLKGVAVIAPYHLNTTNDMVVITTISAGDRVSAQLEHLGFERDVNYFEVMRNHDPLYPFLVFDFYKEHCPEMSGKHILHVGCGGNLGVEMLMAVSGAASVTAIDYNSYGICYPEVTPAKRLYQELADEIRNRYAVDVFDAGLLTTDAGEIQINSEKIRLEYPCSISDLPFQDKMFDLVLHHAVFEHVSEPDRGYGEIFRVLKNGGVTAGLVDPQDHRTFTTMEGYHPLKFLELSRKEWIETAKTINYHNQFTTPEHRRMILGHGFEFVRWENLMEIEIPDETWDRFHPATRELNRKEVGVLRFGFSARRP